ncbi:MAG: alkaline phosphatase D family protein, partial [Actinomycetota bacterium]
AQPNPIVLSGDFHMAMVNEVRAEPRDRRRPPAAVELMTPSLTSDFFRFYTPDSPQRFEAALPANPQVQWSANERGYLITTLHPDHLTAEYRFVDDVTDPESPVRSAETFTIEAGSRRADRTR